MNLKTKYGAAIGAVISTIIGGVIFTEGGYVNNPSDPGGETNFGITKSVAELNGYSGDMKNIPKDLAFSIYLKDYVEKPNFDNVITLSKNVGEKLIDAGVNTGVRRSSLWFQKSLNHLNRNGRDYSKIAEDGFIGSNTITAYKALQGKRGKVEACKLTLKLVDSYQAQHYINLKNMDEFTVGWIANRIGNIPYEHCNDE